MFKSAYVNFGEDIFKLVSNLPKLDFGEKF